MRSLLLLVLISYSGCSQGSTRQELDEMYLGPLSVKLSNIGQFSEGQPWELELHPDGCVEINVWRYSSDAYYTFAVSQQQIDALRSLLNEQRFFALQSEYGELVPDGSTQTLTVTCGASTTTVELHFLGNWARQEPQRITEPARAIRVWRHIRKWFDVPDAVDLKEYDESILAAIE